MYRPLFLDVLLSVWTAMEEFAASVCVCVHVIISGNITNARHRAESGTRGDGPLRATVRLGGGASLSRQAEEEARRRCPVSLLLYGGRLSMSARMDVAIVANLLRRHV